tara:strand:+ start:41 stop:418 length:378 start_codon:yes stop_codon:yes gene_type:complete
MERYLYFASNTPNDTAADEQVAMFPVSKVSHFEMATSTQMRVYFDESVGQETNTGDADISVNHTVIVLTVATGKHKEACQDLAKVIAEPSIAGSNSFVNIADSENSLFCSTHITACVSIDVIDAS